LRFLFCDANNLERSRQNLVEGVMCDGLAFLVGNLILRGSFIHKVNLLEKTNGWIFLDSVSSGWYYPLVIIGWWHHWFSQVPFLPPSQKLILTWKHNWGIIPLPREKFWLLESGERARDGGREGSCKFLTKLQKGIR